MQVAHVSHPPSSHKIQCSYVCDGCLSLCFLLNQCKNEWPIIWNTSSWLVYLIHHWQVTILFPHTKRSRYQFGSFDIKVRVTSTTPCAWFSFPFSDTLALNRLSTTLTSFTLYSQAYDRHGGRWRCFGLKIWKLVADIIGEISCMWSKSVYIIESVTPKLIYISFKKLVAFTPPRTTYRILWCHRQIFVTLPKVNDERSRC